MNMRTFGKYALALTLVGGVFMGPIQNLTPTVQAQYRRGGEEEQKGYRDGLDRGREDADTHRRANPNNSEHFRNGNRQYKDGFRRGYNEGYRENLRRRR